MNNKIYRIFAGTPGLLEHSFNVAFFVRQIIDAMPDGLVSTTQAQDLIFAAMYHDVGKSTWHGEWFTAPRHQIRNVDWTIMQTHPIQSVNILNEIGIPITEGTKKYILEHHERPGKMGYPNNIEPDFYSQIISAADIFCACTEPRSYRPYPLDTGQALREVVKYAPEMIVDALKFVAKKIA